jgi:uncharacterized protein
LAGIVYLDASALVKLVVREAESDALTTALASLPARWTASALAEVEVVRVLRRVEGASTLRPRAAALIASLELIEVDAGIRRLAAVLGPTSLGSLDAIHLASAFALRDELAAFLTYDRRLREAATAVDLPALAPGQV